MKRAGNDQLRGTVFRLIERGRGVASRRIGARRFPANLAGNLIDGKQVGICILIANQNHHFPGENRRRSMTVLIVERTERELPALGSVGGIGDEAEVAEEDVDVLAVGNGRRRCRAVGGLKLLFTGARSFAAPDNFAAGAVETEGHQFFVLGRGQEDARFREHRRGVAGRDGGLPHDILLRRKFGGQRSVVGDACAVRTAELRPVASG